ncbi:MAG: hypothetical protein IKY47_03000 [Bacteroidaceae bacterium]|nr:hypothetical protein [Bacteroidaceae bacterium]
MKKEYVRPAGQLVQIAPVELIAVSSVTGDTSGDGKDDVKFESGSDNRDWGNLWK